MKQAVKEEAESTGTRGAAACESTRPYGGQAACESTQSHWGAGVASCKVGRVGVRGARGSRQQESVSRWPEGQGLHCQSEWRIGNR